MPVLFIVAACTLSGALALAPADAELGSLEGVSHQRPAVRQRHVGRVLAALRAAPNSQDPAELLQQVEDEDDDDQAAPVEAPAGEAPAQEAGDVALAAEEKSPEFNHLVSKLMPLMRKEAKSVAQAEAQASPSALSTPKVDCTWNTWGDWFPCTLSCGGGYQARWREYLKYPQGGGSSCVGSAHELKNCNMHACFSQAVDGKIHCQWGAWSEWGVCSETCGGGMQEAIRMIATYPQNGGDNCVGTARKYQSCYPQIACPTFNVVNCEWSEWDEWEGCSSRCGNGSQTSWRKVKVHPQNGGKECLGEIRRTQQCTGDCKVANCEWAPWSAWGSCSKTCGGGTQQSFRGIAQYPTPEGKACAGVPWREQRCNTQACPPVMVDCAWAEWQPWTDCSRTCGGGSRSAAREVFRHPQNGGVECLGSASRSAPCAMKACPDPRIDCEWGDWAVWTGCSASCGGGTQQTTRMVLVYPQFGGSNCEGDRQMMKLCNTHKCKEDTIDCAWGMWSAWSPCSRSCGNGTTEAFRDIKVFPQNGGNNCEGKSRREQSCNLAECMDKVAINCTWGMWAGWEPCTKSCGGGTQRSWREVAVHPQNGGEECAGSMMRWQQCNSQTCFGPDGSPLPPVPGAAPAEKESVVAMRSREVTGQSMLQGWLPGLPAKGAAAPLSAAWAAAAAAAAALRAAV